MFNQKQITTFGNGYAKDKGESAFPHLWDGLVGAWGPSLGKQGLSLFDLSPYSREAVITNFSQQDITTPVMTVIADNDNGADVKERAFDNNFTSIFATTNTAFPHYIGIDLGPGNSQVVDFYGITARNDGSFLEAPYDWTLEGSSTGAFSGEEVTLDTRVNESFVQSETRTFTFSNTTAFRFYRILVTANQPGSGVTVLGLAEIELFFDKNLPYVADLNGYAIDYQDTMFADIGHITQIDDATQDLTISIWIKTDIAQTNHAIFYYDTNDSLSPTTDFYCMFKTNLTIGGIGQGGEINTGIPSSNFQDNEWHLLTAVLKDTQLIIYDNFIEKASITVSHSRSNYGTSHRFRIADDANANDYIGLVGDSFVYNRALEFSEVIDLYIGNTPFVSSTSLSFGLIVPIETLIDIDTDIRAVHTEVLNDINTDIRTIKLILDDINTDIRATHTEILDDINTDIRVIAPALIDLNTDIRAAHTEVLDDIDTDIRITAQESLSDINTDIRTTGFTFKDIDTDIKVKIVNLSDINTDIRAIQRINNTQVIINEGTRFLEGTFVCINDVTIIMDVENAINMRFRRENETVFSAFEPFSDTKEITLSAGDGNKSIFIQFQDIEGNITEETQLDIVVNSSTPTAVTIEAYEDETATVPIIDSVFQNDKGPFFRWVLPNFNIPYVGFSFALDEVPDDTIDISIPDMVRDGIIVTKATPLPEMTLDISSGFFYVTTALAEFTAETQLLSDGGAQDRIDLVYLDGLEHTVKIVEGIEAASPVAPALPDDNNSIALAEVFIPTGTTSIANVTITDIRQTHVEVTNFLDSNLTSGLHTFQVKAFTQCDTVSNVSVFNIGIANINPEMGEILGYTDGTKTIQLSSNVYQIATNTIFLEWTAAPAEPGPITYHYTTDGSEPTLVSPSTTGTTLNLGPFSEGITRINIKPFDDTTGNSGETKNFIFIFGSVSPIGDTLVISGGTTLKQSLKEVQVNTISWNFDSARICKIFQPVAFDSNLPFVLNDDITVVHNNVTLFSGKIKKIDRTMTISGEGVTYLCTGPRGILTECFATITTSDGLDTSIIEFENEPVGNAVTSIINTVPNVIKNIQSLPTGSDINAKYQSQSVDQVIQNLFIRTKFGWYIKPDGTFVSVAADIVNPNQAKFGVFGTVVNSISPQYNVMTSNLQFDVSKRYNRAIVEGANKEVIRDVKVKCLAAESFNGYYLKRGNWQAGDFTKYKIISNFKVTKVLETKVSYKRLLSGQLFGIPFGEFILNGFHVNFIDFESCDNNKITKIKKPTIFETNTTTDTFPQGNLAGNNIISFPREAANIWFRTNPRVPPGKFGVDISLGESLVKYCAEVKAKALIEIEPLRVDVSVSGTADSFGSKTLRIVDTSFKFTEDPNNPIDDTARMTAFATDKLESLKDIKVNGTITLDTIDTSWTLDNSVNLINTAQGSWTTLNVKVIGINYNFNENTTTLELTSEFLK